MALRASDLSRARVQPTARGPRLRADALKKVRSTKKADQKLRYLNLQGARQHRRRRRRYCHLIATRAWPPRADNNLGDDGLIALAPALEENLLLEALNREEKASGV